MKPDSVYLSEDYCWSPEPEAFRWLIGFLLDRVRDTVSRAEIEASGSFGWLAVDALSAAGRREVLRVLAEELPAVRDTHDIQHDAAREAKALALMALDVLRRDEEGTR